MLLDPFPPPADLTSLKPGDQIYFRTRDTLIPATFNGLTSNQNGAFIKTQQHGILLARGNDIFHPDDVVKGRQK